MVDLGKKSFWRRRHAESNTHNAVRMMLVLLAVAFFAGCGTIPGEARTIPTIAVNTINKLTLGFVSSMKSRHPGRESAITSGSWGAIAMTRACLRRQR